MAKGKISITLQRPNGHTTKLATSEPLTDEAVKEAERLVYFLSTGKTSGAVVRAAIELDLIEEIASWLEGVLATAEPMSPIGYNAGAIDMTKRVIGDLRSGAWRKPNG